MSVEPIKVGVVGLGQIGTLHAENLAGRIPATHLAMVVDADEERAHRLGSRFDVSWSTRYEDLLSDPDVVGIVVAVPTPLHVELIERVAAAGKHVFCEKPISLEPQLAQRAVTAARKAGVHLQAGFHRRFDPDWAAAAARLRQGTVGRPVLFRASFRDKAPPPAEYVRKSGGLFVDSTIHALDLARWLVGEICEVAAYGGAIADPTFARYDDIDTAAVVLRFENGAIGVLDSCRCDGYGFESSAEIIGLAETIRVDNHRRTHLEILADGTATTDWVANFGQRYGEAYLREMESFVELLRDGGEPVVTGEDAVAALTLAQACALAWSGEERIPLQVTETSHGVVYSVESDALTPASVTEPPSHQRL